MCLILFYVHSYGIQFSKAISICEHEHDGDFAMMMFLTFALIMAYLQGDLLEDYIFKDMDRLGSNLVWINWSYFMPPYLLIFLGYALNHNGFADVEHGWRDPTASVIDTLTKTGKTPFAWPVVVYDENEVGRLPIVIISNLVYGFTTLYFQL